VFSSFFMSLTFFLLDSFLDLVVCFGSETSQSREKVLELG